MSTYPKVADLYCRDSKTPRRYSEGISLILVRCDGTE